MRLTMLSDDDVQAAVVVSAARRRGFEASRQGLTNPACSLRTTTAHVVVVDCQNLDATTSRFLAQIVEDDPAANVFVLAEQVGESPSPLPPRVLYVQPKPFHIPVFFDLVGSYLQQSDACA